MGHPIPIPKDDIDWNAKQFSFEFGLGLAPKFEVKLPPENRITRYKITCGDENAEEYISDLRKSYGSLVQKDQVREEYSVKGSFVELYNGTEKENGIKHSPTFRVDTIKGSENKKSFLDSKIGDSIRLKSQNLFDQPEQLAANLGKTVEETKDLDTELLFTIEEINHLELAALNQELFDKVYPEANITSEVQFRDKVGGEMEKMYQRESNNHLDREIQKYLLEETKFDLPKEFLKKWLSQNAKKELTPEQQEEEFGKSERDIKYQLIENKIARENDIKVSQDDIKEFARETVAAQMLQFGRQPDEKIMDQVTQNILQNKEEVSKMSNQIMSKKVIFVCREKTNFKQEEITFDNFVKILSKK